MNGKLIFGALTAVLLATAPAWAVVRTQCPGDVNQDAIPDVVDPDHPNAKCMHLGSGDGFAKMADGTPLYIFGFSDMTGVPANRVITRGTLAAEWPAPTITLDQGDEFFLSLTNVGMFLRPDLFDAHTVHWHGFPQAASVFDGVPDSSIAINMGSTLTYYYNVMEPGTYMYHCHVEATEHMEMGMLGNLYVRPAQDGTAYEYNGKTFTKFAYNDGDGSTGYNHDFPLQLGGFDSRFHIASETVQPLPFSGLSSDYPMINGRGYPDTINPFPLPAMAENGGKVSQPESSFIAAGAGDRVLLRISNLDITKFYTFGAMGLTMEVVGADARLLRGPDGKNLYYKTNSVTLGGGESVDAIVEIPADATPGTTYFLYSTNLNYLSNGDEDFGGMMTEILVF